MKKKKTTYEAMEIAQYIITYAKKNKNLITNLQLQKILYFAWRDYYKETKCYLFKDRIEAWPYGHVVPSVYFKYSIFSAMTLNFNYENDIDIEESVTNIIDKTIEDYYRKRIMDLVRESHESGKSWDIVYKKNKKNISFDCIIENDC